MGEYQNIDKEYRSIDKRTKALIRSTGWVGFLFFPPCLVLFFQTTHLINHLLDYDKEKIPSPPPAPPCPLPCSLTLYGFGVYEPTPLPPPLEALIMNTRMLLVETKVQY